MTEILEPVNAMRRGCIRIVPGVAIGEQDVHVPVVIKVDKFDSAAYLNARSDAQGVFDAASETIQMAETALAEAGV